MSDINLIMFHHDMTKYLNRISTKLGILSMLDKKGELSSKFETYRLKIEQDLEDIQNRLDKHYNENNT